MAALVTPDCICHQNPICFLHSPTKHCGSILEYLTKLGTAPSYKITSLHIMFWSIGNTYLPQNDSCLWKSNLLGDKPAQRCLFHPRTVTGLESEHLETNQTNSTVLEMGLAASQHP